MLWTSGGRSPNLEDRRSAGGGAGGHAAAHRPDSRPRGGGHVGVVSGIDAGGNPIVVSGNNGNRVREAPVSRGRIFAYVRAHPRAGQFLGLANFGDGPESCDARILAEARLSDPQLALSSDGRLDVRDGRIHMPPLGCLWLVDR